MADLLSVRKVGAENQALKCCAQATKLETKKKKYYRPRLKRLYKLIKPNSKCSYKIVKATVNQKNVSSTERFRWIRRVKFILDEVSAVYVYEAQSEIGMEDVTNSSFQDILELVGDDISSSKSDDCDHGCVEVNEEVCYEIIDDIEQSESNEDANVPLLPKMFSCTPIGNISDYLKCKTNINVKSSFSYNFDKEEELGDNVKSFAVSEEDFELLLTKYFHQI